MPLMQATHIQVPESLLYNRKITASAKVVWMVLELERLTSPNHPISITRLAALSGVSRPTVYKALRMLSNEGLHPYSPPPGVARREPRARIPASLITDREIDPRAKVFYGILKLQQAAPHQNTGSSNTQFTFSSLANSTQLHRKTIARAVRALAAVNWLAFERSGRRRPATCRFKDPRHAQSEAEVERAKRRLEKAAFRGEALMREYLNLLVDSDQYEDDAKPGFLVNPLTDERLQFDRYYPPAVAFEFNGPQHYGPTDLYSSEAAIKQRTRDLIKMGLCAERGITLVIVHPQDLNLVKMKEKIGNLLPLRDLTNEGPRIAFLQSVSRAYRRRALSTPFRTPKG